MNGQKDSRLADKPACVMHGRDEKCKGTQYAYAHAHTIDDEPICSERCRLKYSAIVPLEQYLGIKVSS